MQGINAILVRGQPEGEVFTGVYRRSLAQAEVGFETIFLLCHQWDGEDGKDNY